MKVKFFAVAALVGCAQFVSGQVTDAEAALRTNTADSVDGWKVKGVASLNATQTSLTNWVGGGQNSISINGAFNIQANYKMGKNSWENTFDLGYGLMKQGEDADYRKTDDRIDFSTKYGYQAYKSLYYAALASFKSQMTNGYNYIDDTTKQKISAFLAPAYVIGALGVDYKPNSYFSAFVAPLTVKYTIVNDQDLADAGAFGVSAAEYKEITDSTGVVLSRTLVKSGKKSRGEFGGYLRLMFSKSDFKAEALKNLSITSKADFFSNYLHNPQNIDVSWETQIAMKVNKYITVSVSTHLIYDDDIDVPVKTTLPDGTEGIKMSKRVQFKEIAGVGIMYNF
ncbi:MAG: DUF3078 domain-containing protein [Salinivirgaceae bacterium]|nr:DUF3078 domain-containing protein [Salinivirgaceae bacterium]